MENQDLIIQLIKQDLKHNKLTKTLTELGFDDGGLYDLEIVTIVSSLMGIKEEEISDDFINAYCGFMREVYTVATEELENKIPLLARKCFGMLVALS